MPDILHKYENIFHGIDKMKDVKVKVAIDESVTPVAQKHCCVLFRLCDKVDNKPKRLPDAEIIEEVKDTSKWLTLVVIVPNGNLDKVRLSIHMTQANKVIKQVRHVTPTLELWYDLNGAKVFWILDLNKGFYQFELDEDSRYNYNIFNTYWFREILQP